MKTIDGPVGHDLVKDMCKRAFNSKTKKIAINVFRNVGVDPRTDRPYKWVKSNYFVREVISENACIVNPQCGSGLSYRLYSALLYVVGIEFPILVEQPGNTEMAKEWLERYNGEFKDYQQYLRLAK